GCRHDGGQVAKKRTGHDRSCPVQQVLEFLSRPGRRLAIKALYATAAVLRARTTNSPATARPSGATTTPVGSGTAAGLRVAAIAFNCATVVPVPVARELMSLVGSAGPPV